ncbi:glutaredoxin 3 [Amphritea sp. 2_MG-2023]|uniref:glutaredoxin 3 n=1 Tax=Amphritea TaxID=515417 RepID=UPI001C068537|nr:MULTISPECIES: glutaredoxin 3 [Amphritea]MBU2965138.1 glutaredoxin 3 [Amphritea atlantica]MDO6418923.1 glutaredoxin 3 [Amphritea sp. 2_MG-2023]MDX2424593.1 glutaredoxin 3 [Amphritea sp.]
MSKITLYSNSWCPFCRRAKMLLDSKGAVYNEINVEAVSGARQEMIKRSGRTSVPQIFINEHHVGGCDDLFALEQQGKLDKLLAD